MHKMNLEHLVMSKTTKVLKKKMRECHKDIMAKLEKPYTR